MRILLIEDDRNTARSLEMMLTTAGFKVETTDLAKTATISPSPMTTTRSCSISGLRT